MLLGLDLLAGAVKASLSYARLPYLMSLREGREEKVDRTVGVIEKPRLRSSLRLAMAFFHFLLAGLLPIILQVYGVALDIWLVLFYLVLEMALVNILEFLIEGMILKSTEENAIRLSALGGFINTIFSPLAGLLMGSWVKTPTRSLWRP